jgi:DNA-directed RNA polymerase I subunit RPA1
MIREIVSLFGAYGVKVDYRHLYLIGDYMTFGGDIKAMNRNWMSFSASPFLRMSYETSVKFITNSALHCEVDKCVSPSSNIILGQAPRLGTGMCDLLMETGL